MTDTEKILKAIKLLEWLHDNCLVPDLAHDAVSACGICSLLEELKTPSCNTPKGSQGAKTPIPVASQTPIKQGESTPVDFHMEQWPFG